MKKLGCLTLLLSIVLAACSVPEEPDDQSLVETAMAEIEARAMQTEEAGQLVPSATETEQPIETSTSVSVTGSDIFALNYLDAIDQGGVTIEIARVLVGSKDAVGSYLGGNFDELEDFSDAQSVVELIFKVTNDTDQIINLYPDQGIVVIGSEQIDLFNFFLYGVGEDVSGEIYPGVTLIGGLYFGVKRSPVESINEMIINISAPTTQAFDRIGEDYQFQLDLSGHIFEEIPPELR